MEIWRHGDMDMEIWILETWTDGDMETWKHGDQETWTHRYTET